MLPYYDAIVNRKLSQKSIHLTKISVNPLLSYVHIEFDSKPYLNKSKVYAFIF